MTRLASPRMLCLMICVVLSMVALLPVLAAALPDEYGGVPVGAEEFLTYTERTLPASWKAAGYELSCESTARRTAGRALLSDDPHGCACGTDVKVVKDGSCYQVPLPLQ